jgi:integrase
MQGIRRVHGSAERRVAPLLQEDPEAIVANMGESTADLRDRALLLIGFAGAFRRSELVAINCTDVNWRAEGVLITIRSSKTDPFGNGRELAIPMGAERICPVGVLRAWLDRSSINDGPVFQSVTRCGRALPQRLSSEAVAQIVKKRVFLLGQDRANYSGHSLRAGFATSAAVAGIPTWRIRQQTGHSSAEMLGRYIRSGNQFAENAAILC